MKKPTARFYLKGVVTLALLCVLFLSVDLGQLWGLLRSIDPAVYALAVGFTFLSVVISAVKWQLLLRVQGIALPLHLLARAYFIGVFFNNFLPSMVGGDFAKAYLVSSPRNKLHRVLLAVVLDRLTGLCSLSLLLFLIFLLRPDLHVQPSSYRAILALVVVLNGAVLSMVFFGDAICGFIGHHPRLQRLPLVPGVMRKLAEPLAAYRRKKGAILIAILIGFGFYGLTLLHAIGCVRAIGSQAGVAPLAYAKFLSMFAGVLPITINGWGLVEGSFVFLMKGRGLTAAAALSVALLSRLSLLIMSLVGGLCYATFSKSIEGIKTEPAGGADETRPGERQPAGGHSSHGG